MRKKNKQQIQYIEEPIKRSFWRSIFQGLGWFLGATLVVGMVYGAIELYQGWQTHDVYPWVISTTEDNVVKTQAYVRFHLVTPNRTALFYLNVSTTANESYFMGMFMMDYVVKEDVETQVKFADVIYSLPEDWILRNAKDENVEFEEKFRTPPTQKEIRRDPTFYREKDYPKEIPFNEIELTTDYVYRYVDTNETEYNFVVRVREESDDFNIRMVTLITPEGYTITRG